MEPEQRERSSFKTLGWHLISSWKGLCPVIPSYRGRLEQVIHQLPSALL